MRRYLLTLSRSVGNLRPIGEMDIGETTGSHNMQLSIIFGDPLEIPGVPAVLKFQNCPEISTCPEILVCS